MAKPTMWGIWETGLEGEKKIVIVWQPGRPCIALTPIQRYGVSLCLIFKIKVLIF
jgi:hypothetical protein